ncbi:MAG: AmmeMemoRadiSam system protein B [Victivallales bacterium]|nr:AmmeMemoRadiSam system protein B [Victivallales bacterium]
MNNIGIVNKAKIRVCTSHFAAPSAAPALPTRFTRSFEIGSTIKTFLVASLSFAMLAACKAEDKVLVSPLAGKWYSADSVKLRSELDGYLEKAEQQPVKDVIALVLPHAGYAYSGITAAYGIKALGKQYKRIVIIGPSHRFAMQNTLSIPDADYIQTPLGKVPLDKEAVQSLLKHDFIRSVPQVHQQEHSVQIMIPLLQAAMKDFTIVPIVIGRCDLPMLERAGKAIRSVADNNTLVIASSDFVHFGRNFNFIPFSENIQKNIREMDFGACEKILNLDMTGFLGYIKNTGATICGEMSVAALLSALPDNTKPQKLHYATSAEMTGDFTHSVSYLSIAFSGKWPEDQTEVQTPSPRASSLSDDDRNTLLLLARKSIEFYLEKRQVPTPEQLGIQISEPMKSRRAVFVTLKKDGQLRGCIGEIFPSQELYNSVIVNAVNSGVNDSRFKPVTAAELDGISLNISVLTPPSQVASYKDIIIGRDGVVLRKNNRSSVFLPHVATEQEWNLEQTLSHLAMKAGLPHDAWKESCTFLTFQAELF